MYYLCIHVRTRLFIYSIHVYIYTLSICTHALADTKLVRIYRFTGKKTAIKCRCTRRRHSSCSRYMTSDVQLPRVSFFCLGGHVGAQSLTTSKFRPTKFLCFVSVPVHSYVYIIPWWSLPSTDDLLSVAFLLRFV